LVDGQIALFTGLFILILAPEAYLPLRQVGVQFHAAAEGVTASKAVLDILDEAAASKAKPAEADSTQYLAGALNVLVGPSGVGKSTMMRQLAKQSNVAWMPQSLGLVAGTVAENIHGPVDHVNDEHLQTAKKLAALDDIALDAQVGESASQVSGGQAQRIAISRTFYAALTNRSRWLLLDEPISALDADRAGLVIDSLKGFAADGVTVVAITHQQQLISAAAKVIEVQNAK
jgi:ATP-binding cassette subfamily C protein CydD